MQEFFRKLSRGTIAFLCIAIAIILIIAKDPPHNICHSERDQFLSVQGQFINPDPELKKVFKKAKTPQERLFSSCEEAKNSGGCLEYFIKLKKLVSDFNVVTNDCKKTVMQNKKIKSIYKTSLKLLVTIAWESDEKKRYGRQYAWYDQSDLSLFCSLKQGLQESLGESDWENLREEVMDNLRDSDSLSRDQIWKNTILSTPCNKVL